MTSAPKMNFLKVLFIILGQMGRGNAEAVQVHRDPEAQVQPEEQGERGGQADPGHAPRLPDQGRQDLQIQPEKVCRAALPPCQVPRLGSQCDQIG